MDFNTFANCFLYFIYTFIYIQMFLANSRPTASFINKRIITGTQTVFRVYQQR